MSDKYKTVKRILIVCIIGLLISSTLFFQMDTLITIILMGSVFYFFTSPIGALGDSLAQRRANEMQISFGTIRTCGAIGFETSALIIGEILSRDGGLYIIFSYFFFGTIALLVASRLEDD